jgi:D-aspartate ligase
MRIPQTTVPVLVLGCKLGGLAIMRTLGCQGVRLAGMDEDRRSPGMLSRYCRERFIVPFEEGAGEEYLGEVLRAGERLGRRAILIPTSDELCVFVARYADRLGERFLFPRNDLTLLCDLISKEGMYHLAGRHGVPTPDTLFPKKTDDVRAYAAKVMFPVMLKGIHGNRLQLRTGKKMVIVHSADELLERYRDLEDPERPNLMIQEYIPGTDDQIYIFNGYFNGESECLVGFTGHKIRQYPVHVGCASLGVCRENRTVYDLTTRFMRSIGYKGVLDIGYRLDPRDGQYKVLDVNPRVGQAFRLFVAQNGMDVVRSLYLDMTGQEQIMPIVPREGRRWIIEDFDIISSYHYSREGTLSLGEWLRSFKGVEEGAWFSWRDPAPSFVMISVLAKQAARWALKRLGLAGRPARPPVSEAANKRELS